MIDNKITMFQFNHPHLAHAAFVRKSLLTSLAGRFAISVICLLPQYVCADDTLYKSAFDAASQLSQSTKESDLLAAETKWRSLVEKYPDDLSVRNNLAVTQMKLKKFDVAQKTLETALSQDAKIAVIMDNLNELYAYQAQQAYRKVYKEVAVNIPNGQWLTAQATDVKTPDEAKLAQIQQKLQQVLNNVENWRLAWSQQNVSAYLGFYESNFSSDQFEKPAEWRASRKYSLSRPEFIKVDLSDIQAFLLDEHTVEVVFQQRYTSNTFQDNVKKILVWRQQNNQWQIVQERVSYDG